MDLISFLEAANSAAPTHKHIYFRADSYPALFFSQFFAWYNKKIAPITRLEWESLNELKRTLETSFLGLSSNYWLGSLQEFNQSQRAEISAYLASYNGAHTFFVFDTQEQVNSSNALYIDIPLTLSVKEYNFIASTLYDTLLSEQFIQRLFQERQKLTLEESMMTMRYGALMGARPQVFFDEWLKNIVPESSSLFTLSQYFLGRDNKEFFKYWSQCKDNYGEEFWIPYWEDLLWRAYIYIYIAQEKGITEAKKQSHRLPFAFVNKDWKKISLEQLTKAHSSLYNLDYYMKNGGAEWVLDLWLAQWFQSSK